jgi:hypothetical protein
MADPAPVFFADLTAFIEGMRALLGAAPAKTRTEMDHIFRTLVMNREYARQHERFWTATHDKLLRLMEHDNYGHEYYRALYGSSVEEKEADDGAFTPR